MHVHVYDMPFKLCYRDRDPMQTDLLRILPQFIHKEVEQCFGNVLVFLRKCQSHRVSVDEEWSYGDGLRQAALYTSLALKMGVYLSSDLRSALLLLSRETTVKEIEKGSYTCLVQQPNVLLTQ